VILVTTAGQEWRRDSQRLLYKNFCDTLLILFSVYHRVFDLVWHSAFFHKLLTLGLPLCFDHWTQSFLSDRRAKVLFHGTQSRSFRIICRVPQGSVLGPALFILYINDLSKTLSQGTKHSLYADDLAIWFSSPDPLCPEALDHLKMVPPSQPC